MSRRNNLPTVDISRCSGNIFDIAGVILNYLESNNKPTDNYLDYMNKSSYADCLYHLLSYANFRIDKAIYYKDEVYLVKKLMEIR